MNIPKISSVLLLAMALGVGPGDSLARADFQLGRHDSRFYTISVPPRWKVGTSRSGFGTEFFLPPETEQLLTDLGFTVSVMKFPSDFGDYTFAVSREIRQIQPAVTLELVRLASHPAHKFTYENAVDQKTWTHIRIVTVADGLAYDINFSFDAKNTEAYGPLIDQIIESFTIKRPAP